VKRAITVLAATAAGVLWLVTYRVTPNERAVAAAAPPPASPTSAPAPDTGPSSAPAAPATPTPTATPTPRAADGRFTGQVVPTRYGDVQVRITVAGGRLTDVQPVTLPSDRARSAEISQIAGPMLRDEAIQAHSAQIDVISGATYTSEAYAQSVEDALRQDHLG
jgi:uncharacterized protein with FMN-binding domain